MVTMVTGKNQVTIPARLAREHSIEAGSRIEWLSGSKPNELRLRIQPGRKALLHAVQALGNRYADRGTSAIDTLKKIRDEDERDREAELARCAHDPGPKS